MTAYGGLLPVATMLQKLQFQQLIEEHVTIKRLTTSMPSFRFVLAMILTLYVGFSRLNHLQFLQREPMLTGILARSSTSNRQDVEARAFTGVLGVLATLRETLLPVH
jgi:hypothetical protein